MFEHVEPYPGDPILTLNETFGQDPRPGKVNLSIGIYFDDAGQLPVMQAVREAEASVAGTVSARPYLPMEGLAAYRQAVQHLLWGPEHEAVKSHRIATIQTVGGSGGLKVGSDFLKCYFPDSEVWVSDPTWDNHQSIFRGAGLKVHTYPYHDPITGGLRFDDMLATLQNLPLRSIVLLHACCHNPTGIDLSPHQWNALIPVIRSRQLIPYLDMAYQGFGDGLVEDAAALHALTNAGISFFCANSFSKSFSLYGERCGALSVVCPDASQASRVLGQLKATIRKNYSSPPSHGARLVAQVLQTPALYRAWADELGSMRQRIKAMRQCVAEGLASALPGYDVSRFTRQRGMFSYTGLSETQVNALRERYGVYLLRSGRMCVAGLNARNVGAVTQAFAHVISHPV
ncbi:MAG: aromatic amino acid transaminase [Burkholderiales bacterium]